MPFKIPSFGKVSKKGKVQFGPSPADVIDFELTHIPKGVDLSKGKFSFASEDIDDDNIDDVMNVCYKKKPLKTKQKKNVKNGVDYAMTNLQTKGKADAALLKLLREIDYMHGRKWEKPSGMDALMTGIGGAGMLAEEVINKAVGSRPRVKEMVPMDAKRWTTFTATLETAIICEPLPGVGQVVTPIATYINSRAMGKGKGNAMRDALASELASVIDGALTTVSLGIYGAVTEITGQIVAAMTIYLQAYNYHKGWQKTQQAINEKIKLMRNHLAKFPEDQISRAAWDHYIDKMIELTRQAEKCEKRGPQFEKIAAEYKSKLVDSVAQAKDKIKSKTKHGKDEDMLADFLNMN